MNQFILSPYSFLVTNAYKESLTEAPTDKAYAVIPYRKSVFREIIFWSLSILTAGLFYIGISWFPLGYHKLRFVKTRKIRDACCFLVITEKGGMRPVSSLRHVFIKAEELQRALPSATEQLTGEFVERDVEHHPVDIQAAEVISTVVFEYRCWDFAYNIWSGRFESLSFNLRMKPTDIHKQLGDGISSEEVLADRNSLYGPGCIEVPLPPLYKVIFTEIFHPIYVFQMVAVAVWLWDGYVQYLCAIVVITTISLGAEIFEARRNQLNLQRMSKLVCNVEVLRGPNNYVMQSSDKLAPGDVFKIVRGMAVPCDSLVLHGSILVDESMLSGESVPVTKYPIPSVSAAIGEVLFDFCSESASIVYGGTSVIQAKKAPLSDISPLGLVARTGFCTTQGQMMRSIIHPTQHKRNEFVRDTYKFLAVLGALAGICGIASIFITQSYGLHVRVVVIRFLDTFTNAVPPALPATMTVGATFAVAKLRRYWKITCISPSRINLAGQVNTMVLDKTGTLTEEGLELEGILATCQYRDPIFTSMKCDVKELPHELVAGMATCHSLAVVDEDIVGDPMETQLLKFSNWTLDEEEPDQFVYSVPVTAADEILDKYLPCLAEVMSCPSPIGTPSTEPAEVTSTYRVVKRFDFVPALQRMSVLTWDRNSRTLNIFCKGSPEQIRRLCHPSTVPKDFFESLSRYTETGMRVLAFAHKIVPRSNWDSAQNANDVQSVLQSYTRDMAESNLSFLGLVVFANMLKADSKNAVEEMLRAGCRCIMATGDNPLTAAFIARETGMIPSSMKSVIIGDCVAMSGGKLELVWTPVSYFPAIDKTSSFNQGDFSGNETSSDRTRPSTPSSISGGDEISRNMPECGELPECGEFNDDVVESGEGRLRRKDIKSLDNGQYCSNDIQSYMHCRDPRDIAMVLTGAALKLLRDEHVSNGSQWNTNICTVQTEAVDVSAKDSTWKQKQRHVSSVVMREKQLVSLKDTASCNTSTLDLEKDMIHTRSTGSIRIAIKLSQIGSARYVATGTKMKGEKSPVPGATTSAAYAHMESKSSLNIGQQLLTDNTVYIEMSMLEYCLRFCRVYSRMAPEEKATLITLIQSLPSEPLVGMCGDGANDCAALKAADIGLSLSYKEASIAAPFTSSTKSVQSCVDLLREGRGALVSSFQSFKFLALYALIQLCSTCVLYNFGGNLADPQFLWIDLVVALPLTMTMSWTNSSRVLSDRMPIRRLVGRPVIVALIGQISIQVTYIVIALALLMSAPFYVPFKPDQNINSFHSEDLKSQENTVVFLISNFQNIGLALILAEGKPWRKGWYTNPFYVVVLLVTLTMSALLFFPKTTFTAFTKWLAVVDFPVYFRLVLGSIILVNFVTSFLFERWVVREWCGKREEVLNQSAFCIDIPQPGAKQVLSNVCLEEQ